MVQDRISALQESTSKDTVFATFLSQRAALLHHCKPLAPTIAPTMSDSITAEINISASESRADIELQILHRISYVLTHQHDISSLLEESLEVMESEMELSRGTLTLRLPDTDVFSIEASRGLTESERKRGQYKLGEGITGKVAQTGQPAIVTDVTEEVGFLDRTRTRRDQRVSFICVPIIHLQRVI